jgi:AraC family ethanolamine operon transcriptional activator
MSIRKPQELKNEPRDVPSHAVFPGGLVLDVATDDFDEMASIAPKWDQEYLQLGKGPFKGHLLGVHTQRIQIGRVTWDPGILARGSAPRGAITMASLLSKGGAVSLQRTPLVENQIVILQPGQDFELTAMGKCRLLIVVVEEVLLQSYVLARWGQPLVLSDSQDRLVLRYPSNQKGIGRMWGDLLPHIGRQRTLLTSSWFAHSLEKSVIEHLLSRAQPPTSLPLKPNRYLAARRAEEYLVAHAQDPISIAELCAVAKANERTLLLGFHEIFGIPPKSYLKSLRLNRVRQDLRGASQETTVTDVALRWGFTHLSRFAADYRQMFGEFPHETLKNQPKTI